MKNAFLFRPGWGLCLFLLLLSLIQVPTATAHDDSPKLTCFLNVLDEAFNSESFEHDAYLAKTEKLRGKLLSLIEESHRTVGAYNASSKRMGMTLGPLVLGDNERGLVKEVTGFTSLGDRHIELSYVNALYTETRKLDLTIRQRYAAHLLKILHGSPRAEADRAEIAFLGEALRGINPSPLDVPLERSREILQEPFRLFSPEQVRAIFAVKTMHTRLEAIRGLPIAQAQPAQIQLYDEEIGTLTAAGFTQKEAEAVRSKMFAKVNDPTAGCCGNKCDECTQNLGMQNKHQLNVSQNPGKYDGLPKTPLSRDPAERDRQLRELREKYGIAPGRLPHLDP